LYLLGWQHRHSPPLGISKQSELLQGAGKHFPEGEEKALPEHKDPPCWDIMPIPGLSNQNAFSSHCSSSACPPLSLPEGFKRY